MSAARSTAKVHDRLRRLEALREARLDDRAAAEAEDARAAEVIGTADAVREALEILSEEMFGRIIRAIEAQLTTALQEVLAQPIRLRAEQDVKRGTASIRFYVERDGQEEHIMRGQGGSVANVLSVGLRMFALATLDPAVHRRFLVLDEQDCWLSPELVPRLVEIVHEAGRALGFQIVVISHHDVGIFRGWADRIYRFEPSPGGVRVEMDDPSEPEEA